MSSVSTSVVAESLDTTVSNPFSPEIAPKPSDSRCKARSKNHPNKAPETPVAASTPGSLISPSAFGGSCSCSSPSCGAVAWIVNILRRQDGDLHGAAACGLLLGRMRQKMPQWANRRRMTTHPIWIRIQEDPMESSVEFFQTLMVYLVKVSRQNRVVLFALLLYDRTQSKNPLSASLTFVRNMRSHRLIYLFKYTLRHDHHGIFLHTMGNCVGGLQYSTILPL